jgi:hypothetical protein
MKKIFFLIAPAIMCAAIFFACRKNGTDSMNPAFADGSTTLQNRILSQPMELNGVQVPVGTQETRNADGSVTLTLPRGYKLVGIEQSYADVDAGRSVGEATNAAVAEETFTISCECVSKDGPCFPVSAGGTKYSCTVDSAKICTACLMRVKKNPVAEVNGVRMQITHFTIVDTRQGSGFVTNVKELPADKISFNPALLRWPAFMNELNKVLEGKFTRDDLALLNNPAGLNNLPPNYEFKAIKVMGQLTVVALNMSMQQNIEEAAAADTTIKGLTYSCKCSSGATGCTLKVLQGQVPIVSCDPGDCTVCEMTIVKKPKQQEQGLE